MEQVTAPVGPKPTIPKSSKVLPLIAGIGLYLFTTGVSYAVFNSLNISGPSAGPVTQVPTAEGLRLEIDPGEPKTEECPLNGEKFTKTEQKSWEGRRPLAVMIENHLDARPQSGISSADVVYEAVAEGAITRFVTIFYCGAQAKETQVGPVRSARTHFIELASEYVFPFYVHVGGAWAGTEGETDPKVRAKEQLYQYGWSGANDMDQAGIGFPTFWRDYERLGRTVATEHTMYSTTEKLWEYGTQKRGITNKDLKGKEWKDSFKPWSFEDEAKLEDRGSTTAIDFDFWTDYADYHVTWAYDKDNNQYVRSTGGQPHLDLDNKQQLSAKNVVVQLTQEEGPVDVNHHMFYYLIKGGDALVFQNGKVVKVTWSKKDRLSRTIYKDEKGKEIKFVRGKIWVEIVPKGQKVNY